jgi:hypothetical protein
MAAKSKAPATRALSDISASANPERWLQEHGLF